MPTTVPPITSDVLTALRQGDERTLERLFRERYSSLTEEAASVLHHATSAAHCVEGTFVQTWKERERFQTPEELESFLHQCVREGAVQRESRRAVLQHFDSRAAHAPKHAAATVAPPVDEAWARVAAALHAPPPDPDALAHAVADHSRHEAAVHVKEIAKGPPWVLIAVLIAVIVGVSYVGLKALNRASADPTTAGAAIASPDAKTLSTRVGQLAEVTLADGSKVMLGPDSRVRVPKDFGERVRAVGLEGTATFTVETAQRLMFGVRAGNAWVKATGTEFSVRAYPGEDVTVRVSAGQVAVKAGSEERPLSAGRALAVAKSGAIRDPSPQELEEALGWVDGKIVVNNRPLRDVLHQFTRWYGLDLKVKDASALDRVVSFRAPRTSVDSGLAVLEAATGLRFGYGTTSAAGAVTKTKK